MNLTTGTAKDLAIINSFPSEAKLPIGQKKDLMKSGLRLSACPDLVCSRATCNELPLYIYVMYLYVCIYTYIYMYKYVAEHLQGLGLSI